MRKKIGESIYETSPHRQSPAMPSACTEGAPTVLRRALLVLRPIFVSIMVSGNTNGSTDTLYMLSVQSGSTWPEVSA